MISDLLRRITEALESKNIPYMLSGSIAMNSYTVPRMTLNIDIVIELGEENLPAFLSLFDEKYYINRDTVNIEVKRPGMFNIIDHDTGYKIDFIVRKNTIYRKHEFERRKKMKIGGIDVWIVSPEDLIISKIIWIQELTSEKQMHDIKNLLATPGIEMEYFVHWCRELKLNTYKLIADE
jgi:hypothetical protein